MQKKRAFYKNKTTNWIVAWETRGGTPAKRKQTKRTKQPNNQYQQAPGAYNQYNQPQDKMPDPVVNDVFDPYAADGLSNKLSDNSRLGFIRKVLGILALQFALTAVGVTLSVAYRYQAIPFFNKHIELLVISLVGYIVTLYALGCYKSVSRAVPTNYILLFIFTSCMTYMVSSITCYYEPEVVMAAAILTAVTVGALAVYALTTKTDFTYCGGAAWCFIFIFLTGTMLALFMRRDYTTRIFLSCLVIFLCCFYIIYDIQLLVGEKENALSIDDYVFAAMMIYIDIMRLFLEILKVLGRK